MNVSVLKAAFKRWKDGKKEKCWLLNDRTEEVESKEKCCWGNRNNEEDLKLNLQTRRREQCYPAAIIINNNNNDTNNNNNN